MSENKPKQEAKAKKWVTTANRFVVFLDIMGFRDLVARSTHKGVYDKLLTLSKAKDQIAKSAQRTTDTEIYTASFSDSIVMFSIDDSTTSFESISIAAALLIRDAIVNNIPIKGGMAHGEITVNKSRQIFFGQPIIDAFGIEEDMHYYGIATHHTIDRFLNIYYDEIKFNIKNALYKEILTPLKSGKIKHYNIDWFNTIPHIVAINPKSIIQPEFDKVLKSLKCRTSGAPRRYIDNTEEVFHLMYPDEPHNPDSAGANGDTGHGGGKDPANIK